MADVAGCSSRTIKSVRANIRRFGSTTAPPNGGGRPRSLTPPMLDALREHLLEKPDIYLDEMVVFLWDEFEALVTTSTISRALASIKWSPLGATPVQIAQFHRGQRYQILPAYPQDGIRLFCTLRYKSPCWI